MHTRAVETEKFAQNDTRTRMCRETRDIDRERDTHISEADI